ncbi:MAG: BatA and WFA domain-containing protein [Candidatus Electryonea clarkiae]|nr:BatA and WFA domain-containing protein [Candidatus Electryonea clarkiae]MDP8289049.1 BatA and WFA domain-containing protein [Candidatus Electryonea clarkiae]
MTFLNLALLSGLSLAAIPLLIHLLAKRRLKRQPFPTLEFLRRLQTHRMRQLKIRQILLLILRTLAVLFLALAFIRPAFLQSGSKAQNRTDTIILLDLSASMSARRPEGIPVINARSAIKEIINSIGNESRVALVVADDSGDRDMDWYIPGAGNVSWIDRLETDGRSTAILPAWKRVAELFKSSASPDKDLIWISDYSDILPDSLPTLPENVSLIRIPVADIGTPLNVFVNKVSSTIPNAQPGSVVEIEADLAMVGGNAPINVIVTANLDGRRVAESEVTLSANNQTTYKFSVKTVSTGLIPGELQIEVEDALSIDDRFPFVVNIPARQRVLIAGDDYKAIRYLELALNPKNSGSGNYIVDLVRGGLQGIQLSNYDIILLAGLSSPGDTEVRLLQQFLGSGKGLWLFPGNNIDVPKYNRGILPQLGIGPILLDGLSGTHRKKWEDFDAGHPALKGIINPQGFYDTPEVYRSFVVQETKTDRVLIRLSDGSPFLLESNFENGRVWWTSCAVDTSMTDWHISGIFAPMIQSGVNYLITGYGRSQPEIACGEPVFWKMPEKAVAALRDVKDPMDNLLPAVPGFHKGIRTWRTDMTNWPGHYYMINGEGIDLVKAVRIAASESDLSVSETELSTLPGNLIKQNPGESLSEALIRMRHGREISWWFILFAVMALFAETLIAREKRSPVSLGAAGSGGAKKTE